MKNPAKVICKIISVKGTCHAGHQEGQEFDLSQNFLVGVAGDGKALCPAAFNAAYSYWRVLRYGGEFPWEKDKYVCYAACPDPFNPVVMELRRLKE
jgi:uncharacterized repeat protein (TIGR04076 family)